jgi:TIR domain
MREVFLSHASQDQAKARRLRDVLVAHDVPVWFSPHHIRGAQQWQDEIGTALARCRWFLVLLTPHAVKSMWVKRELNYALIEKRYEDRILPLLFKKCNFRALSWTLPQFQMIDFIRDYGRACEELLRVWKIPLRSRGRRRRGQKPG